MREGSWRLTLREDGSRDKIKTAALVLFGRRGREGESERRRGARPLPTVVAPPAASCAIARAEHHGSAHTCPTAGPSTVGGSTVPTPPAAASSPPVFFDDNRMASLMNPLTRDCRGRHGDGRGRVACHVRQAVHVVVVHASVKNISGESQRSTQQIRLRIWVPRYTSGKDGHHGNKNN